MSADDQLPLTPDEIAALAALRNAHAKDGSLAAAEHAYLTEELIHLRRTYRDMTIKKLMDINQVAQELRVADEIEIAAGRLSASFLGIHDALANAIAETASFMANLPDRHDLVSPKQELISFLKTRREQTLDLNKYEGYRLLANRFSD